MVRCPDHKSKSKCCDHCRGCVYCPVKSDECQPYHKILGKVGKRGPTKRKAPVDTIEVPLRTRRTSRVSYVDMDVIEEVVEANEEDVMEESRFVKLMELLNIQDNRKRPFASEAASNGSYYLAGVLVKKVVSAVCELVYPADPKRLADDLLAKHVERTTEQTAEVASRNKANKAYRGMVQIILTHPVAEVKQAVFACAAACTKRDHLNEIRAEVAKELRLTGENNREWSSATWSKYKQLFEAMKDEVCPPGKQRRQRISDGRLEKVVKFILEENSIAEVQPYGIVKRKLSSGVKVEMPTLLRKVTLKDAYNQYKDMFKDNEPVGKPVFYAIGMALVPKITKAKLGLDNYYVRDVFDNFVNMRKSLETWLVGDPALSSLIEALKWAEVFLKSSFPHHIHIGNHDEELARSHCTQFALQPNKDDFPKPYQGKLDSTPPEELQCSLHSGSCSQCVALLTIGDKLAKALPRDIENRVDKVKEINGFSDRILDYCAHEIRDKWQSAKMKEEMESHDGKTLFIIQDYKMKILPR